MADDIGKMIHDLRLAKGMTLEEVGNIVGVGKSTVRKWETGMIANMKRDKISKLAHALGISSSVLMEWDDKEKVPPKDPEPRDPNKRPACFDVFVDAYAIPLLGRVAAGCPLYDEGNIIGKVYVSPDLHDAENYFSLKVSGSSMYPLLKDGDTLIVHAQPDAENGAIAIIQINGNEGVVKKIQKHKDGITLISINPAYDPMYFTNKEIEELPVVVRGVVIEVRSKI